MSQTSFEQPRIQPGKPEAKPAYLPAIGALRGVAALYVVMFHVTLIPFPILPMGRWLNTLVMSGGTGVPLFFIISAFTLCHTYQGRNESRPTLRFYARRVFRIVPLFYFLLVVTLLRDKLVFDQHHSVKQIMLSVVMLFNLFPGQQEGIVWASWSIGVEMLFYAMFPLLFHYVNTVAKAVLLLLASLIAAFIFMVFVQHIGLSIEARDSFFRSSLLNSMPFFAIGMIVYLFCLSRPIWSPNYGLALIVAAISAHIILACVRAYASSWAIKFYGISYAMLVAGMLMANPRFLAHGIAQFYGNISYSIYLLHPLVIMAMKSQYQHFYKRLPESIAWIGCFVLTLGILTPLAFLTFKCVEEPARRWGSRIIKRAF
ncbi:MAG: acyltransferase [Pedosphaera sp.]|nr:acyltransferase [Pedosphaera sp.]